VIFTPVNETNPEKGFYLDLAVLDGGNIETDLARRDFTVNALALPLDKFLAADGTFRLEDILETPGGLTDLSEHLIRPVGEKNLVDDPLRMLRGIRLRAQLSSKTTPWEFAEGTLELFKKHCALINCPAAERVREELTKTWLAGNVSDSLRLLVECDLLTRLIPELNTSDSYTLNLMNWLEWLVMPNETGEKMQGVARPEQFIQLWSEMLARLEAQGRERLAVLFWATLLCNIGNPTQVVHEIMTRLRFSRETTDHVTMLVQHQAWIDELAKDFDPTNGPDLNKLTAYRFLRDTQPVQLELLILSLARYGASNGSLGWERHLVLIDSLARKYMGNEEERLIDKSRLIGGKQLINTLNLKSGPQVGQLLREIDEAQAIGRIQTIEEAIELAKQLIEEGI
jgi:tRNA nucleotidyltransferase/poly(A) polymerase